MERGESRAAMNDSQRFFYNIGVAVSVVVIAFLIWTAL